MTDSIPFHNLVLSLNEAVIAVPEGPDLGPIDWPIHNGERFHVHCANPAQWEALVGVLTGQAALKQGGLEELEPATVQHDGYLLENLDMNQSIEDYLKSPEAPRHLWMDARRRVLLVCVDSLGLSPHMTRQPLRHVEEPVLNKFWALRFMTSRAQLQIGKGVFSVADEDVRKTLRRRWDDIPGAVVAGCPAEHLPGKVTYRVSFDEGGGFTMERVE